MTDLRSYLHIFKYLKIILSRGQLLAEERSVGRLPHVGGARDEEDSPASPPMPRIILRVAALIAVLKVFDVFAAGFRIRIFFADPDPDPGKNLHADPDPGGIGGKGKK